MRLHVHFPTADYAGELAAASPHPGVEHRALRRAQQPAGLLERIVGADADRLVEKQHAVDDAARRAALGRTGQTKAS